MASCSEQPPVPVPAIFCAVVVTWIVPIIMGFMGIIEGLAELPAADGWGVARLPTAFARLPTAFRLAFARLPRAAAGPDDGSAPDPLLADAVLIRGAVTAPTDSRSDDAAISDVAKTIEQSCITTNMFL